ncbi:MAG: threonylcarbamoyl-AMP synthase [Candidatus Margulisbacteria bacterium]|nr:threonylcarbamoyl-AMP synthase [Candidatus Margulisiibacteriota bacterium]
MSNQHFKKAAQLLESGKIIAFPTETVFGIGALLNKPKAIREIFKLKKRPRSKPLQVLIATHKQAQELGHLTDKNLKFASKKWPGPYTFIVPKTRKVPKLVTGGSSKVGLRMPNHKAILKLIKEYGPIVATSANQAGGPPALTVKDVKKALPELAFILPGRVKSGKASKVIDLTKGKKVLRA